MIKKRKIIENFWKRTTKQKTYKSKCVTKFYKVISNSYSYIFSFFISPPLHFQSLIHSLIQTSQFSLILHEGEAVCLIVRERWVSSGDVSFDSKQLFCWCHWYKKQNSNSYKNTFLFDSCGLSFQEIFIFLLRIFKSSIFLVSLQCVLSTFNYYICI